MSMLLVVRHGHAGDRQAWAEHDRARPLSERGRAQAEGLVDVLADREIAAAVSSPALRCTQTILPLVTARDVPLDEDEQLWETTPVEVHLRLLEQIEVPTVWCSHGDVIGNLVVALGARGVDVGADPEWRKSSTWVLELADGEVDSASYLPPPR